MSYLLSNKFFLVIIIKIIIIRILIKKRMTVSINEVVIISIKTTIRMMKIMKKKGRQHENVWENLLFWQLIIFECKHFSNTVCVT